MKRTYLTLFFLCFLSNLIVASDNAGAFLEKSIQARASAMGMSHVSLAAGSDAIYWNPSLLSKQSKSEIKVMQTKAFETQYISIQTLFKVLNVPVGMSYTNAYLGGIKETVESSTSGRYTFTGSELDYAAHALFLSTGASINKKLSIGASAKWIREIGAGYQATGLGVDVGVSFSITDQIKIGGNAQNLLRPSMQWDTPSKNIDTVPTNIKVGGSLISLNDTLLTSVDFNFKKNRDVKMNFGAEYKLSPYLPIRAGLDGSELTLGLGLVLNRFIIDFSWKNPSSAYVEDIYKISIGYQFYE